MPVVSKTSVVPYTQEQMYCLINDISKYKEFVPWCVKSEVLSATEDEIRAMLSFSGGGISKSFTTMNRLQPHKMMEIRLIDGPFKQLEGFWRFEEVDEERSRVMLDLEFEFSSRMLAMMFGPVFNQVAVSLVDAFIKRAREVYA